MPAGVVITPQPSAPLSSSWHPTPNPFDITTTPPPPLPSFHSNVQATSAPTPFSSGASSTNTMPPRPSRMLPSGADVASFAVKMELVATENTVTKTANTILNTQPVKKCQPSLKPMQVGPMITPRNICTLNWQKKWSPASAFALYSDNLSTSMREEYKSKVTAQARSSSTQQAVDGEDAINVGE
ncbi:hypothetical protein EV702DRAFT_1203273 [Suillus placidus]|uniref:Uncharacterized protein n=1 Tax=Suillus placidus TaxID=48579 RepID=A0A9P6ZJ20_9AGAM|nr:hypothetical protein EV702DRAFT_1203273 [Suillus placidus]